MRIPYRSTGCWIVCVVWSMLWRAAAGWYWTLSKIYLRTPKVESTTRKMVQSNRSLDSLRLSNRKIIKTFIYISPNENIIFLFVFQNWNRSHVQSGPLYRKFYRRYAQKWAETKLPRSRIRKFWFSSTTDTLVINWKVIWPWAPVDFCSTKLWRGWNKAQSKPRGKKNHDNHENVKKTLQNVKFKNIFLQFAATKRNIRLWSRMPFQKKRARTIWKVTSSLTRKNLLKLAMATMRLSALLRNVRRHVCCSFFYYIGQKFFWYVLLLRQIFLSSQVVDGDITMLETTEPVVLIHSLKRFGDPMALQRTLTEVMPSYVVMYGADISAIRQLEVYQNSNPSITLKIYFLVYGGSVEEQGYLTSLRREKEAFEKLITTKTVQKIKFLHICNFSKKRNFIFHLKLFENAKFE